MQPQTKTATASKNATEAKLERAPAQKNLFAIVRTSSLEEVREALENMKPIDVALLQPVVEGQTLLFSAVCREQHALEVCRLLIDGFQIQAGQQDVRGQTALHYLAKTSHVECVDLLVARSGNVDHVDTIIRQTPLFYAAHHSGSRMVRRLLELGADPDHKDDMDHTPLFWADTLEAAVEIVMHKASCCAAVNSKGMTASDWHRHQKREAVARLLSSCVEARAVRGRMSWFVRNQDGKPLEASKGPFVGYITTLARPRDVDSLCILEEEFIQDHDNLLEGKASRADLFSQIGLDIDTAKRRNTIKKIATADPRKGPTRHYTLKCTYLPPPDQNQKGAAKRTGETVAYVYFRVMDGERGQNDGGVPERVGAKGDGHIVISHLKVSEGHQRQGVALLLLTGMLQTAEAEVRNMQCSALYLSVMEKNNAAVALYRKLGFESTGRNVEHPGWIHMKRALPREPGPKAASNLRALRKDWHQRLQGVSGGSSAEDSKSAGAQASRKRSQLADEVLLLPAKRNRRLPPDLGDTGPPSPQASQASASTTASSESGSVRTASESSGASRTTHFISDYFMRRR